MEVALGFIGGAVIALAGSIGVARYDRTRRHRVKLHLELLPALLDTIRRLAYVTRRGWEGSRTAPELAAEVEREATVANHADRRHAAQILRFVEAAAQAKTSSNKTFEQLNGQAEAAVTTYQDWLARRFSASPPRAVAAILTAAALVFAISFAWATVIDDDEGATTAERETCYATRDLFDVLKDAGVVFDEVTQAVHALSRDANRTNNGRLIRQVARARRTWSFFARRETDESYGRFTDRLAAIRSTCDDLDVPIDS